MIEYHIFQTTPDSDNWVPPLLIVYAADDEAVREAFPHADRIYSAKWGMIRVA